MNIELDEVVVLDVSDEALELAAGGGQGGLTLNPTRSLELAAFQCCIAGYNGGDSTHQRALVLAIADR